MQDGQAAGGGTPGRSHLLLGPIDEVLASLSALFSRPGEAVNDDNDDVDVLAAALRPSAGLKTGDA